MEFQNEEDGEVIVGKKRRQNKEMWTRNVFKKSKLQGKEYVNKRGETIHAKSTGANCRLAK